MAEIHLGKNQIAIFDYTTRIVHLIHCDWDTSDPSIDNDEKLSDLGWDMANLEWMSRHRRATCSHRRR